MKKSWSLKKARATDREDATAIILDAARKVLAEVQQRSAEAMKALSQNDHLVALGALAGLEEQLRFLTVRLMVLREVEQTQKRQREQRRNA